MNPLRKIIKIVGSQAELARRCGIRQQTVFVWLKTGKIPAKRVIELEKIVKKAVTRHQLRPDLYPLD